MLNLGVAVTGGCSTQESAELGAHVAREQAKDDVRHLAARRGVAFRAIGQEPGWLLEITNGEHIMIATDYGNQVETYPYVEPQTDQDARRTQYVLTNANVVVEIRGKPCADIMSGEKFEVSVTITTPDRRLTGCGRALF